MGIFYTSYVQPEGCCEQKEGNQEPAVMEGLGEEKKESCLHLNAGANELGQSSHFLTSWWLVGLGRTLTWFGSIYTYVIYSDVMNQELSPMEELKSFRPLVFPRWTSHDHKGRSLLVSGLGFLQVKYFVGRINVRGALARLWTAICMASFVYPGNIAQYLLNWIWNMISFANSNPVIFFFPLDTIVCKDPDFNQNILWVPF